MNKIVAGRYSGYQVMTIGYTVSLVKGFRKGIPLSKESVGSVELINEEQRKSLFSAVTRGTVGTLLLGLPGLAAGALTTKNKNTFFVQINYLDDGEPSFAEVDLKVFKKLQIAISHPSLDSMLKNAEEPEKEKNNEKSKEPVDKHMNLTGNIRHCTECNCQIEENMVFCPVCGSKIRTPEEDTVKREKHAFPEEIPGKDNSGKDEEKPVVSVNPEGDKVMSGPTAKGEPEGKYTDGSTRNKNTWIRWVICLFFIGGGIIHALIGKLPIVSCIGFSLFGVVFLPLVNRFLQEHMVSRRKKWIQIAGCIVALILFGIGMGQMPKKNAKNDGKQENIVQAGQAKNEDITSVQKQVASGEQIAGKTETNEDKSVTESIQADTNRPEPEKNAIAQNDSNDSTSFSQESEEEKAYQLKVKEGKKAIYPIPTQKGKGYDKTIARYGVSKIKRINAYMPKVVETVSRSAACDTVVNVDVSDNRSTKKKLVMYADCKNGERFYLQENELERNDEIPLSVKEKLEKFGRSFFEDACERAIKSQLAFPSTYSLGAISSQLDHQTAEVLVMFAFKNAYGLEIEKKAVCRFNELPAITHFWTGD